METFILVVQGDLGEDAFVEMDTVNVIFRGSQHQLGQVDIARVDVHGAVAAFAKGAFDPVGDDFDLGEFLGRDEFFEADKRALERSAEFFLVIVGQRERQDGAFVIDFSKSADELLSGSQIERFLLEDKTCDQFNRIGFLYDSHCSSKQLGMPLLLPGENLW